MIPFIGKTLAFLVAAALVGGILTILRFAAIGFGHPASDNFILGFFLATMIHVAADISRSEKF